MATIRTKDGYLWVMFGQPIGRVTFAIRLLKAIAFASLTFVGRYLTIKGILPLPFWVLKAGVFEYAFMGPALIYAAASGYQRWPDQWTPRPTVGVPSVILFPPNLAALIVLATGWWSANLFSPGMLVFAWAAIVDAWLMCCLLFVRHPEKMFMDSGRFTRF